MTMTVTKMIETLLLDPSKFSNQQIVDKVLDQFPEAKTTTKSVASVASTMRRFGLDVAKRDHESPNERIKELEEEVRQLKLRIEEYEELLNPTEKAA